MAITPGENVGPYRIMEQLGSGGMATVFKAYQPSLDRYVAVKVLHPALKQDPQFFERFKREARLVAKLEHPGIIPVYDFNDHKGEPYLVMRYIEGQTLKSKMNAAPLSDGQVLQLMRPVCQALDYAHKQGVLHRDIKPSNIMITNEEGVLLTDFGLARMVQAGESTLSQDVLVGTPQYISPEQAQGVSQLDGRTDIYSLGVVLYEIVTGRVPFNADTPFATVHDHIYSPLPLPSDINPKIDPALERLLLKTLAKDPNDRYQTAGDLLQALEATLNPQTSSPAVRPAAEMKRKRASWWVWATAAVLIVCLFGLLLVGIVFFRARNKQPALSGNAMPAGQAADVSLPEDAATDSTSAENAELLIRRANEAMRQQLPDAAIELYEQAVAADPHQLEAFFGLSQALKETGNIEASTTVLQTAVDSNPESFTAWVRLGENQLFAGREPEEALISFERAAALEPDMALPYAGQAIALVALGRSEEAKQAIETAFALEPDSVEARLANAFYLRAQGQRSAALREVRQIIQDRQVAPLIRERARQLLNQMGN